MNIVFLETEDLIEINKKVVKDYGGLSGVRDISLLESACHNPQNLHFYQNADFFEMSVSYAFSIIQNHPFLDGNKRTAFASMIIFLNQNDVEINLTDIDEAVEIMVKIATKKISFDNMVKWLKKLKKIKK
jgi:death-on-curing protein